MQWAERNPHYGYGIAPRGDFIVGLDVDPRNGGHESLKRYAPLPRTFTIATASKVGRHYYFRVPAGAYVSSCVLAPGIDLISDGKQMVGPGTVINGVKYTIIDSSDYAELPADILAGAKQGKSKERKKVDPPRASAPTDRNEFAEEAAYARAYLRGAPGATQGGRNDAYFQLAAKLKDRGVPLEVARELLDEIWCVKCDPPYFDEAEKGPTILSALSREVEGGSASDEFDDISADPNPYAEQRALALNRKAAELLAEKKTANYAPVDVMSDEDEPRDWIFTNEIMRRILTGIVAPGGIGKSALTIAIAVAAATGDGQHLGWTLAEGSNKHRYKTLLISNEDDKAELKRRVRAACAVHEMEDRSPLQGWIHSYADEYNPFVSHVRVKGELTANEKDLAALEQYVREHQIDIVIFDPFVEMHRGDEKDAGDVAMVMQRLRTLCVKVNVAGIIVHHSRKTKAGEEYLPGEADDARGSGAFRANVRRMYTLLRPSKEDIEKYNMKTVARRRLRLDVAKGSYSADDGAPKWYEVLSVGVGSETAVALKKIEPEDQTDNNREMAFDVLYVAAEAAGKNGLVLKDAAEMLLAHETTKGLCTGEYKMVPLERAKHLIRSYFGAAKGPLIRKGKVMAAVKRGHGTGVVVTPDPASNVVKFERPA